MTGINQSLTALGLVIKQLVEYGRTKKKGKRVVQFRGSVLTKLLKNSLVGNSKTVMLAAVGPVAANRDETLSTLRFADRVKSLETHVEVNYDTLAAVVHSCAAAPPPPAHGS